MTWTEPSSPDASTADLEARLWSAANQLWANAAHKPSEFSPVVLGTVFLRFADVRFTAVEEELAPAMRCVCQGLVSPWARSEWKMILPPSLDRSHA